MYQYTVLYFINCIIHCINTMYYIVSIHCVIHCINTMYCINPLCDTLYQYNVLYQSTVLIQWQSATGSPMDTLMNKIQWWEAHTIYLAGYVDFLRMISDQWTPLSEVIYPIQSSMAFLSYYNLAPKWSPDKQVHSIKLKPNFL